MFVFQPFCYVCILLLNNRFPTKYVTDCKEWQPVQNQNGDVEEFVSVCCGETQTVGITGDIFIVIR